MIEDDVEAIVIKTKEYYNFIKNRIDNSDIDLSLDDQKALDAIHFFLITVPSNLHTSGKIKFESSKNILETCITYLQLLDRITKEYNLFAS